MILSKHFIFSLMKTHLMNSKIPCLLVLFLMFVIPQAQSQDTFFDSDEIIEMTLRTDMKSLMKDRKEESNYHQAEIAYTAGGSEMVIPLKVKTRGHFRKLSSNCKYPPLRLNFKKSVTPESSVFHGMDKVKLVTPCKGDEFVVREYLVYKIYNLITPRSFNVRLVKLTFENTSDGEKTEPYYGMIIEEEKAMAKRNDAKTLKKIGLKPQAFIKNNFLEMAVFAYLVGNTDWSIQYLQNTKMMIAEGDRLPTIIPYDFDHAGIVRAPYAKPAPELLMSSIQERRYRGYCIENLSEYDEVLAKFNSLKQDIYSLYKDNPHLKEKYKGQTVKFLDKFYETINDPKKLSKAFKYPCDPHGTGRVVIKGLRKIEE